MEKKRELTEHLAETKTVDFEENPKDLAQKLAELGCTTENIADVLRVMACFGEESSQQPLSDCGYRVFSEIEEIKFSYAFRREIRNLLELRLLKNEELEKLLLEAYMLERSHIGLKELRELLRKTVKSEERLMMMAVADENVSMSIVLN